MFLSSFFNHYPKRITSDHAFYQQAHTTSTHMNRSGLTHHPHENNSYHSQNLQHVFKTLFLNMNKIYNDILMIPMDKFKSDSMQPSLIISPYLFLSGFKSIDIKVLKQHGITHVLNVAREIQLNTNELHQNGISTLHIKAQDGKGYNMLEQFKIAFEFIEQSKREKGKVVVHCARGISRSATVVIAYLMYRYKMKLKRAYAYVKACRPKILPNRLFMLQLKQFEMQLFI